MSKRLGRDELLSFPPGASVKGYRLIHPPGVDDSASPVPPIGGGGSGLVFLTMQVLGGDVSLHRAMKFFIYRDDIAQMTPHDRTGPVSGKEFLDEITNISRLSHEYLLKVIDAGTHDSQGIEIPFIVTDFIPGPTLKQVIEGLPDELSQSAEPVRDFTRNPTDVLEFLLHLARAIQFVHEQNFVHCDIAPKNVFVDTRAGVRPVLGDLGIMKDLTVDRDSIFVVGTRDYMPPEARALLNQEASWEAFKGLQPWWDIYSFCITAAEFLAATRARPWPPWLRVLETDLGKVARAGSVASMNEVIERLEFLQPSQRETATIVELSGSVAGKRRRLMPVEVTELSERMHRLVRHPALVRLAKVPQITSVKQLFPGAKHDRYEHSLGIMETIRRYLLPLLDEEGVLEHINAAKLELALLGGLLFNLTRFPFSNIVHEIHQKDRREFPQFSRDDLLADVLMLTDPKRRTLPDLISRHFPRVNMDELTALILGRKEAFDEGTHFVYSLLSSSLDARVIDFVRRDSLHVGVARGDAFDLGELLPHLTVYRDRLALRSTGVTVAEQILSLRYWLFNRVYWNRPNRTYCAMIRHLMLELSQTPSYLERLRQRVLGFSEDEFLGFMLTEAESVRRNDLVSIAEMLCAPDQRLYHTVVDITPDEEPELQNVHTIVGTMNFVQLNELAERLAAAASGPTGTNLRPGFLVDMPFEPGSTKLGDDIMVIRPDGGVVNLTRFSAIVGALNSSFDRHLRRLRVFADPDGYPREQAQREALRQQVRMLLVSSVA